ncbi:MAG: hypothetical protein HDT21_04880 [Ruminococcus sp.]|nr:hypothetical protein [Ruminococcus sp.]
MLVKKLKNIVVCGVMVLSIIMLFSGCDTEETSSKEVDQILQNMPDIVFVMYHYYPLEREYKTGNFIGTSGYYIEKTGEIKYFEFEDEEPVFDYDNERITIEEYSNLRDIKKIHKKILENNFNTDYEPIQIEDLVDYHKYLLKINSKYKLEFNVSSVDIVLGLTCFYGVKINENKEEEYILIYEYGDFYYDNDNKYAKKIYAQLKNFFGDFF